MARSETTKQSPGNDAAIDHLGWGRSEGIRAQRTQRTKERSMNVGMMMVFASYGWENCPDARVWDSSLATLSAWFPQTPAWCGQSIGAFNLACKTRVCSLSCTQLS